jgi:hypothetical protein
MQRTLISEIFVVKNAGGSLPRRLESLGSLAGVDFMDCRIGYEEGMNGG